MGDVKRNLFPVHEVSFFGLWTAAELVANSFGKRGKGGEKVKCQKSLFLPCCTFQKGEEEGGKF